LQGIEDRLKHRTRLVQDLVIPEAQHNEPLRFEEPGSSRNYRFAVLTTVDFDHKLRSIAVEVERVGRHRVLPSESETVESGAAQMDPEFALSVGHLAAQSARLFEVMRG